MDTEYKHACDDLRSMLSQEGLTEMRRFYSFVTLNGPQTAEDFLQTGHTRGFIQSKINKAKRRHLYWADVQELLDKVYGVDEGWGYMFREEINRNEFFDKLATTNEKIARIFSEEKLTQIASDAPNLEDPKKVAGEIYNLEAVQKLHRKAHYRERMHRQDLDDALAAIEKVCRPVAQWVRQYDKRLGNKGPFSQVRTGRSGDGPAFHMR